jgi:outer membrane protein insertion porin family
MLKYSLEFRVLFSGDPTVYGFLFADMGNVWSDYDVIKLTDLKRSAGIGFRLYMPMLGVLGYDMGYGFDSAIIDGNQKHGWEHHFVFGMPIN